FDREMVIARAEETYDRGWSYEGVKRQLLAIVSQPDRTAALSRLRVPTLVMHGQADPMVHPSGGTATAQSVRGSKLITYPGMGHDLREELVEVFVSAIARNADRAGGYR